MEYKDFKIRFLRPHYLPDRGEVFTISVESPAGNDQGEFIIPFSHQDLTQKLLSSGLVTRSGSFERAQVNNEKVYTTMNELGTQLFSAIFGDKNIKDLYLKNLSMIQGHSETGLRIKLCINPEYQDLARLMNLPWEYIYDPLEKRDFLNLFEALPVVRYLDLKRPVGPIKVDKLPLKILVMLSSPADYPELDIKKEKLLLREAFVKHPEIQVDFLEKASLLDLKDRLSEDEYHIFHYIGHGGFDKETGQGILIFEDPDGGGFFVSGEKLKRAFRGSSVGIVFLNACETARISAEKDPFAGVASSLMIENILAVVAMQFPISDTSAIVFSKKFYTSLAQGNPIDQAVTKSRQAIDLSSFETLEWGIPVLFMRSENGVVFELKEKAKLEEMPSTQPSSTRISEPEGIPGHGRQQTRSIKDKEIPAKEEKPKLKFCRACGERLVSGAKFCKNCGTKII